MEERQTSYTIMEGYELPSKGLIYDKPVSAHVELRSMSARDEMKRLAPSTTPFKTLADLIENCLIEKPAISVYDMALGDYEFLLHKLRIVTYGPEYQMTAQCTNCGEIVEAVANLESLEIREFDQEKFEQLRQLTLTRSNHLVGIRFQTPRMLDEIALKVKEMKRKYKNAEMDFETLVLLKTCIESVDGVILEDYAKENFINKLPAADMLKIVQGITTLNRAIGINSSITVTCSNCQEEFSTFFRFGPEFFRPTNI